MELKKVLELQASDYDKLKQEMLQANGDNQEKVLTYLKQYDPELHAVVVDLVKRPDKITETENGTKQVPVARLPIPMQKVIVRRAAGFLCGNPIELDSNPQVDIEKQMVALVKKVWEDNKLDFESKKLAKQMMIETEVAELWYVEPADRLYWKGTKLEGKDKRLRVRILGRKFGDTLVPVFNNYGDMVAFGRGYMQRDEEGKEVEHFDVYTPETTFLAVRTQSAWDVKPEPNPGGKIPIIYYSQELPEWADVERLIARLETSVSNHADTNDYFGAPIVKVSGKIKDFAGKDERGKVIEMETGGDASYMTWDQTPESTKLEYTNLRSLIMDMTDTPDISFENMSKLGQFSGVALKLLFMGAHMKAADHEEDFGVGIQRRINYLKHKVATFNIDLEAALQLPIKPKFKYFLPKDEAGMVELLSVATNSKQTMSRETAVRLNPLVQDPDKEIEMIKNEVKEEAESAAGLDRQNDL